MLATGLKPHRWCPTAEIDAVRLRSPAKDGPAWTSTGPNGLFLVRRSFTSVPDKSCVENLFILLASVLIWYFSSFPAVQMNRLYTKDHLKQDLIGKEDGVGTTTLRSKRAANSARVVMLTGAVYAPTLCHSPRWPQTGLIGAASMSFTCICLDVQ